MMTNIEECKLEDLKIGADVEVRFSDIGQGIILPKFKLVTQ